MRRLPHAYKDITAGNGETQYWYKEYVSDHRINRSVLWYEMYAVRPGAKFS